VVFENSLRIHLESQRDALTAAMDRVFDEQHDMPMPDVMTAIRQELGHLGVSMNDEWLLPYAEVIAGGRRVKFELG
jgi:hypothetical protein